MFGFRWFWACRGPHATPADIGAALTAYAAKFGATPTVVYTRNTLDASMPPGIRLDVDPRLATGVVACALPEVSR